MQQKRKFFTMMPCLKISRYLHFVRYVTSSVSLPPPDPPPVLMKNKINTVRELEDLIIEAICFNLLQGKLNQKLRQFQVCTLSSIEFCLKAWTAFFFKDKYVHYFFIHHTNRSWALVLVMLRWTSSMTWWSPPHHICTAYRILKSLLLA